MSESGQAEKHLKPARPLLAVFAYPRTFVHMLTQRLRRSPVGDKHTPLPVAQRQNQRSFPKVGFATALSPVRNAHAHQEALDHRIFLLALRLPRSAGTYRAAPLHDAHQTRPVERCVVIGQLRIQPERLRQRVDPSFSFG